MNPTPTFPFTTNLPKVSITLPADPSIRISLVEETLRASLYRVVINSKEGKIENSRAFFAKRLIRRITNDNAKFKVSNISITNSLRGTIINNTIMIIIKAITLSANLNPNPPKT
jgi:hypothetical protein